MTYDESIEVFAVVVLVAAPLSWITQNNMVRAMRRRKAERDALLPDHGEMWRSLSTDERRACLLATLRGEAIKNPATASLTLKEFDTMGPSPDHSRPVRLLILGWSGAALALGLAGGATFLVVSGLAGLGYALVMQAWFLFIRRRSARSVERTRRLHHS